MFLKVGKVHHREFKVQKSYSRIFFVSKHVSIYPYLILFSLQISVHCLELSSWSTLYLSHTLNTEHIARTAAALRNKFTATEWLFHVLFLSEQIYWNWMTLRRIVSVRSETLCDNLKKVKLVAEGLKHEFF